MPALDRLTADVHEGHTGFTGSTLAAGSGQQLKASAAKVASIRAVAGDVTIKDNGTVVWVTPAGSVDHFSFPLNTGTDLTVDVAAGGTAYITYQ